MPNQPQSEVKARAEFTGTDWSTVKVRSFAKGDNTADQCALGSLKLGNMNLCQVRGAPARSCPGCTTVDTQCKSDLYVGSLLIHAPAVKSAPPAVTAWWKLEANSRPIAYLGDSSGNGFTLSGNAKPSQNGAVGGYDFDGTDATKVCLPKSNAPTMTLGKGFAISVWAKPSTAGQTRKCLICRHSYSANTGWFVLNDAFGFGGPEPGYKTSTALPVDKWTHVLMNVDANKVARLYYDGVLQGATAAETQNLNGDRMGNKNVLCIGASDVHDGSAFAGAIWDTRLYDEMLTVEQISSLAGVGSGYAEATWYRHNPTSGPTSYPTNYPTNFPTNFPTNAPTRGPSNSPTRYPTNAPTRYPSDYPTNFPTGYPTNPSTINYEIYGSRVDHVEGSACHESGTNEYTMKFHLNFAGRNSGWECIQCNAGANCAKTGTWRKLTGTTGWAGGEIKVDIDAWEDDNGGRCDYNTGFWVNDDDCRYRTTCKVQLKSVGKNTWGTSTCGNGHHKMQYKYRWWW